MRSAPLLLWFHLSVALAQGSAAGPQARQLLDRARASLAAGAYADALNSSRQAAALFHSVGDSADEALAFNASGSAELYSGEYDAAVRSFGNALALDRKLGDAKGEITRLSNIGNVYFFQGRYLDALHSYQEALARVGQTTQEPWNAGRRGLVLTNLAALYEQLGQNEEALRYYQQALAGARQMQASERAQLLSNVGTLYRRLGDAVKALETYRQAQGLYAQEHLSDGEIHVLQNIGIARALDLHDLNGAVAEFSRALTLAQAGSNRREAALAHLFRGEAFYRMGRASYAARDFSSALAEARAIGGAEEQWTALYGLGRIERDTKDAAGGSARALATFRQAIEIVESLRTGLGDSPLKTEFLANKRGLYDAAIDLMLRNPACRLQELFALLEKARSRNLQDALRAPIPGIASVQARLAPGSMLLEYWLGPGSAAVFWITPRGSGFMPRLLSTSDAAGLHEFAAALERGDPAWAGRSTHWARILLDGVRTDGVTQLLIVPDGALAEIPFEALDGGSVLRRFAVSYLPSAALLLRPPDSRRLMPWQRRLLAFGDPVVDSSSALPDEERWTPLPDSARELGSIRRVLPGAAEIHQGRDDYKRYLFSGRLAAVPLLHISTHAALDLTEPNRSRILFTPETGQPASQYLFRAEVQSLPLHGADLVTLSACDTERGKLMTGEGVQSFSRAFLAAGARSTVTTLWRAADRPSADLMRLFYQELAAGKSKAASLRAAKLRFFDSGTLLAQPRYWALFILTGDGQQPVPPIVSWLWFAFPAVAAAAVSVLSRYSRKARRYRGVEEAPARARS